MGQRHHSVLFPAGAQVVLRAEPHLAVVDREQPVIGERYTMSVATKVIQNMRRAAERRLSADYPFDASHRREVIDE